jgi:hypothetical protein
MSAPRIFISMGSPYNDEYLQFRDALEEFLRNHCKADPRIIDKNEYPSGNPLDKIREVMRTCHGVIVVAYERKYIERGTEKRGSERAIQLSKQSYTTPWNHIESAMAYTLDLPIYIICQNGLVAEGLIETKMDWYVLNSEISKSIFTKTQTVESIKSWVEARVLSRSRVSRTSRAIRGQLKISEMTPKELFAAVGILAGSFTAGATAATLLPKLFH